MPAISVAVAEGNAASAGGADFASFIVLAAVLAAVAIVVRMLFARRAASNTTAVVGDLGESALAIRIAPAPPFPDNVAHLRALLGDTSPQPRITRYTVPIVTVNESGLSIRDRKAGHILSIPVTDIASVQAGVAPIKPKGTLMTATYPSLWVTVKRGSDELAVALTPLAGAYDRVSPSKVDALAAAITARLAAVQA